VLDSPPANSRSVPAMAGATRAGVGLRAGELANARARTGLTVWQGVVRLDKGMAMKIALSSRGVRPHKFLSAWDFGRTSGICSDDADNRGHDVNHCGAISDFYDNGV